MERVKLDKEKGRILKTSAANLEHTDHEKEVAQSNWKRMHQSTAARNTSC